jgi:ubiquinone biosynthesis protein COQ9
MVGAEYSAEMTMTDAEFDAALIAVAFEAIAAEGWRALSIPRVAQDAGLDLARARARMPDRTELLRRFGIMADAAALSETPSAGTVQERLFDLLMRRLDVLQAHRAGMLALLRALPADPLTALWLTGQSLASMSWLLAAAGVPTTLPFGPARVQGLLAVWLWTLRAWQADDTADLAPTMAALDAALARASQIARSLPGASGDDPEPPYEPPVDPQWLAPSANDDNESIAP